MEKINRNKVILITFLKILCMLALVFTINNWANIKQSFSGEMPALDVWIDHSFTFSNLIFTAILGVVFYTNTLKHYKELAEKRSNQ